MFISDTILDIYKRTRHKTTMTYTTDELLSFTKKRVKEISRELNIQGRTKMSHNDLIDAIVEASQATAESTTITEPAKTTQDTSATATEAAETSQTTIDPAKTTQDAPATTTKPFEFASIPKPEEFFNQVIALNDVMSVHQACNALLAKLAEDKKVSTISKDLSAYRKPFYKCQHSNPDLNETVKTAEGNNTQHIAAMLLTLSEEQQKELAMSRNQNDNARAGFDSEGELREVEKPPVDIAGIVKKSCEFLASNDPYTIACGILNLTGLRANEQNMPARQYPQYGLIERDMVVLNEFVIGFKGVSKKHNLEGATAYYARATLAPAQMVVDAQKRFLSSKQVQGIPTDYEKYRKGFQDTFSDRFKDLFGQELSTIEAYNDDGELVTANGSTHKARAFYACALRAILKTKNFPGSASIKYIQQCLAQESESVTIKYLGRYDESEFINPINIDIPTNIKELGYMNNSIIEQAKTKTTSTVPTTKAKKAPKDTFDIDAFINGLDGDLQVKFAELMNSESSLTNAVLAVITAAKQKTSVEVRGNKKTPVADEVAKIVEAIMTYNINQELNTNCVIPTYTLINKISERVFDKSIAKVTVDNWMKHNTDRLDKELVNCEIPGGLYNSKWNNHHRKTMDTVIESVITIFNKG